MARVGSICASAMALSYITIVNTRSFLNSCMKYELLYHIFTLLGLLRTEWFDLIQATCFSSITITRKDLSYKSHMLRQNKKVVRTTKNIHPIHGQEYGLK